MFQHKHRHTAQRPVPAAHRRIACLYSTFAPHRIRTAVGWCVNMSIKIPKLGTCPRSKYVRARSANLHTSTGTHKYIVCVNGARQQSLKHRARKFAHNRTVNTANDGRLNVLVVVCCVEHGALLLIGLGICLILKNQHKRDTASHRVSSNYNMKLNVQLVHAFGSPEYII